MATVKMGFWGKIGGRQVHFRTGLPLGKNSVSRVKLEVKIELTWQNSGFRRILQIYKDLGLNPTTRTDKLTELAFKREILGFLTAARSGHGHFAAYHERFLAWRMRQAGKGGHIY